MYGTLREAQHEVLGWLLPRVEDGGADLAACERRPDSHAARAEELVGLFGLLHKTRPVGALSAAEELDRHLMENDEVLLLHEVPLL